MLAEVLLVFGILFLLGEIYFLVRGGWDGILAGLFLGFLATIILMGIAFIAGGQQYHVIANETSTSGISTTSTTRLELNTVDARAAVIIGGLGLLSAVILVFGVLYVLYKVLKYLLALA